MESYTHKELDKEIKTISGYFVYHEEKQFTFRGREVLYAVGFAAVDSSCCGVGGCPFIEVPGYVVSWKSGTNNAGNPISKVDPITSDEEAKEIKAALDELYPHSQINFC
jgi:hypothetical protein